MEEAPANPNSQGAAVRGNLFFLGDMEVECVSNHRAQAFAPPTMRRAREKTDTGISIGATNYSKLLSETASTPSPKGAYWTCVLPHFAKPKIPRDRAVLTRKRVIEGMKQDGLLAPSTPAQRQRSDDDDEPSPSQLEAYVTTSIPSPAPRLYRPEELLETDLVSCLPSRRDEKVSQLNPDRLLMPPPPPRDPATPRKPRARKSATSPAESEDPQKKRRRGPGRKVVTTNTVTVTEEGDKRMVSNTTTTIEEEFGDLGSPSTPQSPAAAAECQPSSPAVEPQLDLTSFMGETLESLALAPPSPSSFRYMQSSLSPAGSLSPMRSTQSPRGVTIPPSPGYFQNPYQPPRPTLSVTSSPSPALLQSPTPASPSKWVDQFPNLSPIDGTPRTPSGGVGAGASSSKLDSTSIAMMRAYMQQKEGY